ncbi:YHYH protein [Chitinimonas sp.]|uniref:YHYH protein n=1 Tax=Chitinimonas sp. TaxID=1934313 RepID=UPI0035AFD76C
MQRPFATLLVASLALPGWSANIDINQLSPTQVSATLVPDEADIGSSTSIWVAATLGGTLYLRSANHAWAPSDGSLPVTLANQPLGPVNSLVAVSGVDISGLNGLDLYLAYGQSIADATGSAGHLGKLLSVGSSGSTGLSAAVDITKLPMGDGKVSTSQAVRGQIYACTIMSGGGGAAKDGPWINSSSKTFDLSAKVSVAGKVKWTPSFSTTISGSSRIISSNGLPPHATGTYPVASSDPAFQYDSNPNSIKAQTLSKTLPANPVVAASPSCLNGGAIGILTTGAVVFNGLDAENRDAVAHEVQDRCQGHPERNGSYHYHNVSACIKDKTTPSEHSPLVGYAYDGFGIYGRYGENGKLLSNADLDECHGHSHEIDWDGKRVTMYHYHATWEYPYTLGCYRGTPVR